MELVVSLHGVSRVGRTVHEVFKSLPDGVQLPVCVVPGGEGRSLGLHRDAELQLPQAVFQAGHGAAAGRLLRAVRRRGQREAAPPAFGFDEPLSLQPGQRRTDHGPADAEFADQGVFAGQLRARRKDAVDDAAVEDRSRGPRSGSGSWLQGYLPNSQFCRSRRAPAR